MTKYCKKCNVEYDCSEKKCPDCKSKLVKKYTEEEMEEIQKQNDDFTIINMMIL